MINCKAQRDFNKIKIESNFQFWQNSTSSNKNWHLKDIEIDTLPGISLYRVYDSILREKQKDEVVVALIDTDIDIEHKDLESKVWQNDGEIANNAKDDDKNGYVDDVNGWNFLGNKEGEKLKIVSFEFTRILKKNKSRYRNLDSLSITDPKSYNFYKVLIAKHKKVSEEYQKEIKNYDLLHDMYFKAKKEINTLLGGKSYTLKTLDSIRKYNQPKKIDDFTLLVLEDCIKNNIDDEYVIEKRNFTKEKSYGFLSFDYNDRKIQGDNENDILDTNYGNNIVNGNLDYLSHATKMAGVINSVLLNTKFKIMPLVTSTYGDEHDKDLALAIRYAVDNGAKVINMSLGKEFSLHKDWVFDAIKYAENHDVLIISSAGNFGYDLNTNNYYYPNDNEDNGAEISDNFMLVGATTDKLNEDLKAKSSNYGDYDVDLFAPGEKIATLKPNDGYMYSGGTSSAAAITSGVAALIYSYYPNLSASEVKHILMDSGLEFSIEVKTPTEDDKNKTTPFNKLSKSGKILNAYNAMIMADSISRAK